MAVVVVVVGVGGVGARAVEGVDGDAKTDVERRCVVCGVPGAPERDPERATSAGERAADGAGASVAVVVTAGRGGLLELASGDPPPPTAAERMPSLVRLRTDGDGEPAGFDSSVEGALGRWTRPAGWATTGGVVAGLAAEEAGEGEADGGGGGPGEGETAGWTETGPWAARGDRRGVASLDGVAAVVMAAAGGRLCGS